MQCDQKGFANLSLPFSLSFSLSVLLSFCLYYLTRTHAHAKLILQPLDTLTHKKDRGLGEGIAVCPKPSALSTEHHPIKIPPSGDCDAVQMQIPRPQGDLPDQIFLTSSSLLVSYAYWVLRLTV